LEAVAVASAFGSFAPNTRSGFRLRATVFANAQTHARKPAQFQPLTHLSGRNSRQETLLSC